MAEKKTELAKSSLVEEVALSKINQYVELGMVLPEGFNPTNSLKKARMILNDMKVNGKPVLEVCTKESIIQCLIDSCCKGLDYSESQIYFIPRGNVMTNLESVYGRITRAKRASKYYKPIVQYVHEGDVFEIGVDVTTGKSIIKRHETSVENLDKPIVAAYAFVTDDNDDTEIFIMTKREWLLSWRKSSNGAAVAKEFERDMIYRTIVKKSTKSLVNAKVPRFMSSFEEEDSILADNPSEGYIENRPAEHTALPAFVEAEVVETRPADSTEVSPAPEQPIPTANATTEENNELEF